MDCLCVRQMRLGVIFLQSARDERTGVWKNAVGRTVEDACPYSLIYIVRCHKEIKCQT